MHRTLRGYCERAAAKSDAGTPIRFVAATDGLARDGLIIDANAWQLDNYRNNPVFLWAHDYTGSRPPIGRVDNLNVDNGKLMADVTFDQNDEFARSIEAKYRGGFLNTVSVGWDTHEAQPTDNPNVAARVTKAELLDISAVPVPGDPNALIERQRRALAQLAKDAERLIDELPTQRGALPYMACTPAPIDAAWDAGKEIKAATTKEQFRRMFAWVDDSGDPDNKSSYKLPHHTAEGDVVWRGVAAAMARLSQSDIPEGDQQAVYDHLAKHYAQFDKEPPKRGFVPDDDDAEPTSAKPSARATWEEASAAMAECFRPFVQRPEDERAAAYKKTARDYARLAKTPPEFLSQRDLDALSAQEIRGLFLEGEPELHADLFAAMETRAGAVLSQRNLDDLKSIVALAQGIIDRATKQNQQSTDHSDDAERASDPLAALYAYALKGPS